MIPAIQEYNSVTQQNRLASYATLHQATVSLQEMGERTISTQVRIDGSVVPDFNGWELRFKGERFVLNTKDPQAMKDNTTRNSLVDLTFTSWVINELKRYYMFEPASVDAGTVMADKYKAQVGLNVEDFAVFFNKILNYYFGSKVVFSLYLPGTGRYSTDRVYVDLNYTYIWDVLTKFYELYGVRWTIDYNSTTDVYTIKAGYQAPSISDHDFEYGYQGGLLKFERQVQDVDIRNILLGRGGEKNLPYRYFKLSDPQNPEWAADPDAIPELANITFDRLRDVNFRWYVRGWMHNPNRDTSGDEAWDPGHVFPTYTIDSSSPYYWAYQKGLTDETFNPVEYVKDDASIAEYGERWGAVEDNDEIFPTIQGISRDPIGRIDETVAVSEIVTDDIEEIAKNAAIETSLNSLIVSTKGTQTQFTLESEEFTIPVGSTGNIRAVPTSNETVAASGLNYVDTTQTTMVVVDSVGNEYPVSGISAGTYRLKINLVIHIGAPSGNANGTFGYESIKLTTSDIDADAWKPTFDIWVKNIWNTSKNSGESDVQYSNRVWGPILGDRAGNEAKVVFSTGFMSISEDYEFVIIGYPVRDTSKTILVDGVEVQSEWRITLRKSDAEYDATGLYIPNATTGGAPVAGDKFFFTGIDMPQMYVEEAEKSLNTNKAAALDTTASVSPTWIINLDKVRCNTLEDGEYGQTLAERLAPGTEVWITDPRFTPGTRLMLYVNSMTYTWNEPSDDAPYLVPDIEVVLSDKVMAAESTLGKIQNDISMVKEQYARISDVERAVMSVAEPMFLKKTGESDTSDSPTQFASKVTSKGFRQGAVGGRGWGLYRDNTDAMAEGDEEAEGDSVLEVDKMIVRKTMQVNSLVVNQVDYRGGMEMKSAAKIEVTKVIETQNSYVCYFDQRKNSVANNFVVGDIAYGHVFSPTNETVRYFRRLVTAVDVDRIELSKSVRDGNGVPEPGDVVVQYGNMTNTARQYVIVTDVIGGGYERMISGLNAVDADGEEYYFAGNQSSDNGPRWFVGNANGENAEYENGHLNIKGRFSVYKNDGTYQSMADYIDNNDVEYLREATNNGTTLVDGGLILTNLIALGQTVNNQYQVRAGINGQMNLNRTRRGGGVAAWFGGPMSDLYDLDQGVTDYAKTLFRFDGSGYLAKGHIYWDEDGYGGIPGIAWQSDGQGGTDVIIGANVKLASVSGDTVTDLLNAVNAIADWFEEVNLGDAQNPAWALRLKKKNGSLARAFVSYGDQIVIEGTPGQGGGGWSASYLYELNDFRASQTRATTSAPFLLYRSGTGIVGNDGNTDGAWTYASASDMRTALELGAAATYGVGSVASGNTGLVTGGAVWAAIDNLPEPMVFRGSLGTGGTITSLPVNGTANVGDTYKVITAGTYAGQVAKIGDTFICQTKTSSANTWVLIPSGDEPEGTVTSVGLTLPTGLVLDTDNGSASPITGSGTFVVAFQNGYAIPTSDDVAKGVTARGYFNHSGVLTYDHGGTGLSSYTKGDIIYASANNTLAKLGANTSSTKKYLTMASSTPSWASIAFADLPTMYWANVQVSDQSSTTAEPTFKSVKIGDATLTWVAGTGGAAGYLNIDKALVTQGDQIVIDGTPGGGSGGGGASYIYELLDFQSGVSSRPSNNKSLLMYDTTKTGKDSVSGAWTYVDASSVGVTTDATQSVHGLMSAADKTKLDGIATGATAVSETTVSGWGFTKNTGTVTSVNVGSTSYSPTDGVVSLPAYPTIPSTYDWSAITSTPTTLSGYGITDANISDGVITLGDNTITPLTSHQTIYKLTLQAGSFTAGTYTPNSAAETINVPTNLDHISDGSTRKLANYKTIDSLKSKGSASMPVYFDSSGNAQEITSLDLLSKNTGYVKANRVYLTSDVYFYTETVNNTVCVRLNAPFITAGDQIVVSGTPGGGGGAGGAGYLYELGDTLHDGSHIKQYDNSTNAAANNLFAYNGTAWYALKLGTNLAISSGTLNATDTVYTHPTNGANTTISAADGKVLSAITVNNLGHVTSVSSKTLAATDIPDLSATYQTKYGFTISGTAGSTYNLANFKTTDANVTQTATTTSAAYEILFSATADNTTRTEGARKTSTFTYNPSTKALSTGGTVNGLTLSAQTTGFKISGGTTSKTLTVGADYTLAAACAKGVTDNSTNADVTSSDTNLITGRTLYYQLAKKGYTTNTGTVTSITLKAGTGISLDTDNTAITTQGTRTISLASGVATAGTYRSVTVDTYGRVTAGTNPTTISGYGITDAYISSSAVTIGSNTVGSSAAPIGYSTHAHSLWPYAKVSSSGGTDVNTLLANGGIVSNYGSPAYWGNTPTGMQYGSVFQLNGSEASLNAQFAWDINHNTETPTRSLWFRARNNLGWAADWKQIYHTGNLSLATLAGSTTLGSATQPIYYNGSALVAGTALGTMAYATEANYLPLTAGSGKSLTGQLYITLSNTSTAPNIVAQSGLSTVSYFDIRSSDNKSANVGFISGSNWGVADYGGAYLFVTGNSHAGGLFVNSDGVFYSNSSSDLDKYPILHSNNYSSYALPLSGGTLSNSSRNYLFINTTNASGPYVTFTISNSVKGYVGYYTDGDTQNYTWLGTSAGTRLFLDETANSLRVGTNSANYTVWHAGNDGASSGLDADLLDGRHLTQIPYLYNYGTNELGNSTSVTVNDLATYYASTGMIYAATDNPLGSAKWVHVWSQTWSGANTSWVSQIAVGTGASTGLYYRTNGSSTIVGKVWTRAWDNANAGPGYAWECTSLTATGHIYMANAKSIYWADSNGTSRQILNVSASNQLLVGYGTIANSATTFLYGNAITFNVGSGPTEAMRINSSGNVGIGTSSPSYLTTIYGTSSAAPLCVIQDNGTAQTWGVASIAPSMATTKLNIGYITGRALGTRNSGWMGFYYAGSASTSNYLTLGIYGNSGTLKVYYDGTMSTTGDQVVSSDATLKTNLQDVTYSVADIAKARAVSFDWKDGRGHSVGSIAQDWKPICPELVHGEEGNMTLAYGQLALVNTILLARQSESHEERIKRLEAENIELKKEIERLKMN